MKRYPVPAILVAERENDPGTYEIIDGLQRLHAIVSYIETSFPTLDGKYFNLDCFPTAKSRADLGGFVPAVNKVWLSQKEVSTLLDYVLALSVMRNATESEVNDVFGRINTYGRRLSDQERRQAGVQNEFSDMIRTIACTLRGDVSMNVLPLRSMPIISIDLPMTKHGYMVKADEVFWVKQGILRSTDLRDSMDEQCIADIAVCIVQNKIIERAKDELDEVYESSERAKQVLASLKAYGANKFEAEFKHCVDEILKVCAGGNEEGSRLRSLLFERQTTNPFPSTFAVLLIAFHELIFKEKKLISDYSGVRSSLAGLNARLETTRRATSPEERRKNIDVIKGLIDKSFISAGSSEVIYSNHANTDIEGIIRRSQIELADYELKQGFLSLSRKRDQNGLVVSGVIKTICAMANNGPSRVGKIIIGVCDKEADAGKAAKIDSVHFLQVGGRYVVGINREARALKISVEAYVAKWRDAIRKSQLSEPLKSTVLSSIDYSNFYGLGIIVITVPAQQEVSFLGDEIYCREGDSTIKVESAKQIASLTQRFSNVK